MQSGMIMSLLPVLIGFIAILQSVHTFKHTQISILKSLSQTSTRNCFRPTDLMMSISPTGNTGQSKTPPPIINALIKFERVRLIVPGEDVGEDVMLGIFSRKEALEKAAEMELDLVLINDKADPPVCKVIDYGKFKYSQEKKKKENLKKQIKVDIKEVKMSYKIDQHDIDVRIRAVQKFIGDGDRVKVIVQFKGREMQHKELGKDLLMKIYQPVETIAVMEGSPKIEGRSMTLFLTPKKVV